jgi:hypothetical protein
MDKNEFKKRVLEEEDYVRAPKFGNSLMRFLSKYGDGVENATIARLLMMPEEEVEKLFQEAIEALKKDMVDED